MPLDVGYPAERVGYMVEDAGVGVVVTEEGVREGLGEQGVEVVCLDREWSCIGRESTDPPRVEVTPENLCYVIYTSGSTGRPKGTEVPHRAIQGFFRGVDYARFDERQTLLQHSSTSWDALTLEMWPALLTGGRCVLHPGRSAELESIAREVEATGVTTLWLTSALFNLAVDTRPELLRGVAQVMTGGEAVSAQHVRRAMELAPGLRLVNGYGPSECTVFVACRVITPDVPGRGSVPIGVPIGDRRVFVLDRHLNPVPVGVPGELCVGGPAVPRGYRARPEQTAGKLVPDPFGKVPGSRLYRTGDRVRWLASGELEFLGRIDRQTKVRGFRIELEEIEAVLVEHERVSEAAATVLEDLLGEKQVVAYVVAERGSEVSSGELREYLRGRVPEHMVPGALVVLEALPLTAHGKVDRRALPAPQWSSGKDYTAPRTATEEIVAGIWAEVLKRERVGVEEGFFELGGHSLLAMQVVSRIRRAVGVEVPLRTLFEAPTVVELAARIEALQGDGAFASAPPIERVPRTKPLPVSFAQQRLWLVDRLEPGSAAYNMPFALRLRGALEVEVLRRSLEALVERHETLRTTFAEQDGTPVQVIHAPMPVVLPVVDLRGLAEAEGETARLAGAEALRPF
ncbi:MAG TPA: amino acid adenylation domain-containing protein, partial [Longimicrobiaceae bacterium]|nr:amino acid adenylation domain-containing protein [Longimicrobiaceae bacterium]